MEFHKKKPIYLQIGDIIFENILTQKWKGSDKIPSVREMAVLLEVNPNTVMRTYAYLQDQNIIYNKRGIGYFIAQDAREQTLTIKKEEFITSEMPYIFKSMKLLNISIDDIAGYLKDYEE